MRLDHIAYRVLNRRLAAAFYIKIFDYIIKDEFEIVLEDKSKAKCIALEPNETKQNTSRSVKTYETGYYKKPLNAALVFEDYSYVTTQNWHSPPDIFVSDGPEGSLIHDWVVKHGGVGGIHHLAYEVDDIHVAMENYKKHELKFLTDEPMECDNLLQIFSFPNPYTGIIYEFIQRKNEKLGFCKDNVKKLMDSTKELS